jgi:hypothetical protein
LELTQDECLFAVGSRLFEYCFEDATYPHYQQLLVSQQDYPLVRFINSTLWYLLVGDGWKHWHDNCLKSLEAEAAAGKTINYIAGGNDFYQMLKRGIYNIRIIDPFLPSQDRYYAENWQWLIQGDINDEIICNFDTHRLVLKRAKHVKKGTMHTKLSTGHIVALPQTETTWEIYKSDEAKSVGNVVIDRKFAEQDDFSPDAAVVCSYDELLYAIVPEVLNGWGINPGKINSQQNIYVKQLRKPVDKNTLMNMRSASMLNYTDVRFINYASDPH